MSVINIKPNNIIKNAELNLISNNNFNVFDFGELSEVNYAKNSTKLNSYYYDYSMSHTLKSFPYETMDFDFLAVGDNKNELGVSKAYAIEYKKFEIKSKDYSNEIDVIKNADISYTVRTLSPLRVINKVPTYINNAVEQMKIYYGCTLQFVLDLSNATEVDIDKYVGSTLNISTGINYLSDYYRVSNNSLSPLKFTSGFSSVHFSDKEILDKFSVVANIKNIDTTTRVIVYQCEMPICMQCNYRAMQGVIKTIMLCEIIALNRLDISIEHSNVYSSNPSNVKKDLSKEDTEELNDDVILSIESNPFIHKNTRYLFPYTNMWSTYVYNLYKGTKKKCSITIRLGKYYDTNNNLVYNENSYIKVDDKVVVYKIDNTNDEVPILTNDDGSPMVFRVMSNELNYDNGKISITLILEENK